MTGHLQTTPKGALGAALVALLLAGACGKARVLPPKSPFPPTSRWEKPLDVPLASPLATDGTLVFAAFSDGPVVGVDPATGATVWTRPGPNPGFLVARKGLVVFVEKSGMVWGLNAEEGNARWKTTTRVADVHSVRLDGNRVFIGGASGLAAVVASTGELRFDLPATDVFDLDVAGDSLASLEEGALVVRNREDGAMRFRLASKSNTSIACRFTNRPWLIRITGIVCNAASALSSPLRRSNQRPHAERSRTFRWLILQDVILSVQSAWIRRFFLLMAGI